MVKEFTRISRELLLCHDYCKCGNIKQKHSKRCKKCFHTGKRGGQVTRSFARARRKDAT